jgi:hypothetical protein
VRRVSIYLQVKRQIFRLGNRKTPTILESSYVVDTTELVSLLNPNGLAGKIIRSFVLDLFTPYKAIDEIWNNRRRLVSKESKSFIG